MKTFLSVKGQSIFLRLYNFFKSVRHIVVRELQQTKVNSSNIHREWALFH